MRFAGTSGHLPEGRLSGRQRPAPPSRARAFPGGPVGVVQRAFVVALSCLAGVAHCSCRSVAPSHHGPLRSAFPLQVIN